MASSATTPNTIIATRHLVGMGIAALANPLIYYGGGFYQWSVTLGAALLGAAVIYGVLALFFTERAKAAWPRSFYMLAWVLLALVLAEPWLARGKALKQQPQTIQNSVKTEEDWGGGDKEVSPSTNWSDFKPVDDNGQPLSTKSTPDDFDPSTAVPVQAPAKPTTPQLTAEDRHYQAILQAHPDAFTVAKSQDFQSWIARNPMYQRIMADGTTDEIIGAFNAYKYQSR